MKTTIVLQRILMRAAGGLRAVQMMLMKITALGLPDFRGV